MCSIFCERISACMGDIQQKMLTDFKSIFASTPIRESRMRLTIHFSPSSFDRFRVFESSLEPLVSGLELRERRMAYEMSMR